MSISRDKQKLKTTVAERINKLLERDGITEYRLTKEMGLSPGTINKIRNLHRLPSLELLIDLADKFKVSTDYLVGRETES